VDFSTGFNSYISEQYQEDPTKYQQEIKTLERLRQDIKGAGKDLTGRDILYRCNIIHKIQITANWNCSISDSPLMSSI
jgi:hypothetical protein